MVCPNRRFFYGIRICQARSRFSWRDVDRKDDRPIRELQAEPGQAHLLLGELVHVTFDSLPEGLYGASHTTTVLGGQNEDIFRVSRNALTCRMLSAETTEAGRVVSLIHSLYLF